MNEKNTEVVQADVDAARTREKRARSRVLTSSSISSSTNDALFKKGVTMFDPMTVQRATTTDSDSDDEEVSVAGRSGGKKYGKVAGRGGGAEPSSAVGGVGGGGGGGGGERRKATASLTTADNETDDGEREGR
jgi:hypothetical protein